MPNLNMPGEEGGRPPVQPMMPKRDMGGLVKIVVIVLVVLAVGVGGFFMYKAGKLPFLSKKTPPPQQTEVALPEQMAPPPAATPPPTPVTTTAPSTKKTATSLKPIGTGSFTVSIASFRSKQTANEEASRWTNAGFPAMVTEKRSGSSIWYRVSLGRYETRKTASKAAKDMEHMFETGYWVDRVE